MKKTILVFSLALFCLFQLNLIAENNHKSITKKLLSYKYYKLFLGIKEFKKKNFTDQAIIMNHIFKVLVGKSKIKAPSNKVFEALKLMKKELKLTTFTSHIKPHTPTLIKILKENLLVISVRIKDI